MVHSSIFSINSFAISDEMWFLTADPVVHRVSPTKALREFLQEA